MSVFDPYLKPLNAAVAIRSALLPSLLGSSPGGKVEQELMEWAAGLERDLPELETSLAHLVAEARVSADASALAAEVAIEWLIGPLLEVERGVAAALSLFRESHHADYQDEAGRSDLVDRVEDALCRCCEMLRDSRWELMAIRAERAIASRKQKLSLDQVRSMARPD